MSYNKNFRVTVNVSNFFFDHRNRAKIFINDNIKTISDLELRIKEIFSIENFYLCSQNEYLPPSEDIRILEKDDIVWAVPNAISERIPSTRSAVCPSEEKVNNKKRPIADDLVQTDLPPKKKKKKKRNPEKFMEETVKNTSDSNREHRKKQKITNNDDMDIEFLHTEVQQIQSKKEKVKNESSSNSNKTTNKTSNTVEEKNNILNINTLLPVLQSHINSYNKKNGDKIDRTEVTYYSSEDPSSISSIDEENNSPTESTFMKEPYKCKGTLSSYKKKKSIPTITNEYLKEKKINVVKIEYLSGCSSQLKELSKNKEPIEHAFDSSNVVESETTYNIDPPENYDSVNNNVEKSNCGVSPYENVTFPTTIKLDVKPTKNCIADSRELRNGEEIAIPEDQVPENHENPEEIKSLLLDVTVKLRDSKDNISTNEPEVISMIVPSPVKMTYELEKSLNTDLNKSPEKIVRVEQEISSVGDNKDMKPYKNNVPKINGSKDEEYSLSPSEKNNVSQRNGKSVDLLNESVSSWNSKTQETSVENETMNLTDSKTDLTKESNHEDESSSFRITNRSQNANFSQRKQYSGIGQLLGQLRSDESYVTTGDSMDSSCVEFVTKRRRKRVRKRKKKVTKNEDNSLNDSSVINNYISKPIKTKAYPTLHLKFEEEEGDILKVVNLSKKNSDSEKENESNAETTVEKIVIESDSEDINFKNFNFSEEYIRKSPSIKHLFPKIGDIIAFKILRITENYTPEISSYITGRVIEFNKEGGVVTYEILYGADQCEEPRGNLTLDIEETASNNKNNKKEFIWTDIIDPKLLYP